MPFEDATWFSKFTLNNLELCECKPFSVDIVSNEIKHHPKAISTENSEKYSIKTNIKSSLICLFKSYINACMLCFTETAMQIPVFTFSVHLHLLSHVSKSDHFHVSVNKKKNQKNIFQKCPRSLCSLSCPCVVESCIFWASLVSFMHLCTSQKWAGILDNSTCKGERNKPVSHSLSCLKWCRMDAIWRSHSLRSSSPPGKFGLFFAPPIFISKSVNML